MMNLQYDVKSVVRKREVGVGAPSPQKDCYMEMQIRRLPAGGNKFHVHRYLGCYRIARDGAAQPWLSPRRAIFPERV